MMIRRRVVALISALLMLFIAAVAIGGFAAATQSDGGREWIRKALEAEIARAVNGRVHLGTLSGSFLTDLTVDSVRIADRDDSVFVATGPITVTLDPRDLADGRLILRSVRIDRPFGAMRRDHDGIWTTQKLWMHAGERAPRRRSAFGAVILLEQVVVNDGEFVLMMPWRTELATDARARDSVVAEARKHVGGEVDVDTAGRPTRVWRWRAIDAAIPRARLAHPDSVGARFEIARLDLRESDPPFVFTELTGDVRVADDTVHLDLPHFRLPASTGSARGVVVRRRGEGLLYAIRIESDTVALADIAWISDAIPTIGGGSMVLDISNAGADARVMQYAISEMDVRSHRSRLRGAMTWGVGGPLLTLRDVDLEATPLDVALLERFNGGPLGVPLRGRFTGRIRARGGPLDHFVVDSLNARFADDNVEGATATAAVKGELDITDIANTVFRGVDLTLTHFDLRTAQALDVEFPRLNGTIRGTARLDSSWLDVRLSDADISHQDGDSPVSRLRGTARIDWAEGPINYELDATALPLSFTALVRSFPAFPLRGEYSGPLRVRGETSDLEVSGDLTGPAGRMKADGRIDIDAPGMRVAGSGEFTALDLKRLLEREAIPGAELNGRVTIDVRGDSLADLVGESALTLDRSLFAGARIFAGGARLRFDGGHAFADTLFIESAAVDVAGRGALGLHAAAIDTFALRMRVDSLGGLRPWLRRPAGDSIDGSAYLDARAVGWVRGFDVDATATASDLLLGGNTASALRGSAHLTGLPTIAAGVISLEGDSLQLARFGITSARIDALRDGSTATAIQVAALGASGTSLRGGGLFELAPDSVRVRLDSLSVTTALHRWRLELPAQFGVADGGFRVDTVDLRATGQTAITVAGRMPAAGSLDLRFGAQNVPAADLAELLQLAGALEGHVDLRGRLTGTREAPQLDADGELRAGLLLGIRFDTLRAVARAVADQLDLRLTLGRRDLPAMTAEGVLPLHLGLDGSGIAMRDDGPLNVRVRTDSLALETFESLTRGVTGTRGTMFAAMDITGTWSRPLLDGTLRVRNGVLAPAALGNVRWRSVEADLLFARDSIAVQRVVAVSGADRRGRAEITGWMKLGERGNPLFDLHLVGRNFHAYAQPNVADLDLSGDVQLRGSWREATLRGTMTADRAIIAIPELANKDVISLEDPDRFGSMDTTAFTDLRELPNAPTAFLENLTIVNLPVVMGRDVWLRSTEANINLGGQVNITRGRVSRGRNAGQLQLALDGPLQTVRGTYRLNLGPVQRTFVVEQGEIRFFGDAELNPTLDIDALHTVRQYSAQGVRPDVRVRVHLGGTLLAPTAELSTPDSVRVTNSDLISYLVTGGPSFEIGRDGDLSGTALAVVLGSFGSVIGGKAAGGLCDDANVSTAGLDAYAGPARDVGAGILSGIRINCARQVGDRAFVRLDAGLCQVGQLMSSTSGNNPLSFTEALGVKLDYLLSPGLSASVGVEPPTSAVLCSVNANASARGFVPTPRQVGFDLFRVWRF